MVREKVVKEVDTPTRRLTLQRLLAEGSEIWVVNRSGQTSGKEAGNIVMQVGSGNAIDVVAIPPGNDPVCLTDQATPKMLAECQDLFKYVRSGGLELLDPAKADEYYKKNVSRKKIMSAKVSTLLDKKILAEKAPNKAVVEAAAIKLHPKVSDTCLKAKHAAITEGEALERLVEQESVLTEDDYNYLQVNGVFSKIKSWASKQLKHMAVAEDDDPVETSVQEHA